MCLLPSDHHLLLSKQQPPIPLMSTDCKVISSLKILRSDSRLLTGSVNYATRETQRPMGFSRLAVLPACMSACVCACTGVQGGLLDRGAPGIRSHQSIPTAISWGRWALRLNETKASGLQKRWGERPDIPKLLS